jgi:uncharacterized protein (DUF305 family)
MTPIASLRAALAGLAAVLTLVAAPLGYAAIDTTGILHDAGHHGPGCSAGAPTVTTCNAGMDAGMSGMGMDSWIPGDAEPMMETEAFDLMFIDVMIRHHESAISMANVVLEESTDPVLLGIAEDIVDTQSAEIAKLQEWRARWYRTSPTLGVHGMREMDHLQMMGIMDADSAARLLRTAPEQAERAFVNAMILHHQGVTMLFEMAVLHAEHPEIAGLAGMMLEAHHEQLMTLQTWQLA